MNPLYYRSNVPILQYPAANFVQDALEEEDLDSVSLQFDSKRFYVDAKRNWRGRFLKIAEVGMDGRKSRILLTMTAADDLKDKILDLTNVYSEVFANKEATASTGSPSHANPISGIVKSHILNYPHRRYYVDLKKNARGHFLRITMVSSNARIRLAIPAEGMKEVHDAIASLLKTWWIPASKKPQDPVNLPSPRSFRIDNRVIYFDPVSNRHGQYLRISQVWASHRSAITIPGRSIGKFREIVNELADALAAIEVEEDANACDAIEEESPELTELSPPSDATSE